MRYPKRNTKVVLGVSAILAGVLSFLVLYLGETPNWRMGGSAIAETRPLDSLNISRSCTKDRFHIVIRGDSHTLPSSGAEKYTAFPMVLAEALGKSTEVKIEGAGGDTAGRGLARWQTNLQSGDLLVLVYGTNDAAPRGFLTDKTPTGLDTFRADLGAHVKMGQRSFDDVLILAPPPGGSSAIAARLKPYREETRRIALRHDVRFLDPAIALEACPSKATLTFDALHMTPEGHKCLGQWLAKQLCNNR